jgi:Holliday junction resolvase-like predicted endonuclease
MGTVQKASFETVWAALQETDRIVKENALQMESMRESDKELRERQGKLDQWKEVAERILQHNAQLIGRLGNRFGEMVEYMVVPNLIDKFQELGFEFTKAYQQNVIKDKKNNIFTEIDITLEDGDKAMIVEVKSKPTTEDVTEHIERMEKVRAHADLHNNNRKYLGAIAGMVFNDNVKAFAMKKGFFVIEPSGETFTITPPNNKPKEW